MIPQLRALAGMPAMDKEAAIKLKLTKKGKK